MSSPWNWESVLHGVGVVSAVVPQRRKGPDLRRKWESYYSLVHDDRHGVVEDRLAKDDRVQLWVDLVRVEDGENGHRIRG